MGAGLQVGDRPSAREAELEGDIKEMFNRHRVLSFKWRWSVEGFGVLPKRGIIPQHPSFLCCAREVLGKLPENIFGFEGSLRDLEQDLPGIFSANILEISLKFRRNLEGILRVSVTVEHELERLV